MRGMVKRCTYRGDFIFNLDVFIISIVLGFCAIGLILIFLGSSLVVIWMMFGDMIEQRIKRKDPQ
jgi:hypothetical protein